MSHTKLNANLICLSLLAAMTVQAAGPSVESQKARRFIEISRFSEQKSLPPKLAVTFETNCNQRFVSVLRNDEIDKGTDETKISVGVLIEEDPTNTCGGPAKELTVPAGPLFSGRPYKVIPIKH